MIDLTMALEIARRYYAEHGPLPLDKVYETETGWVVFGGDGDMPQIGAQAIAVSRENGTVSDFFLPSRENFAILKKAKPVDWKNV